LEENDASISAAKEQAMHETSMKQNIGWLSLDHMALYPRRQNFSTFYTLLSRAAYGLR
jgi:hypothetical protein